MSKKTKITIYCLSIMLLFMLLLFIPTSVHAAALVEQVNKGEILKAWRFVLGIVDIVAILALIFIAIANILRINLEAYNIRRLIPALIMGLIAANFSHLICRVLIDFVSLLGEYLLTGGTGTTVNGQNVLAAMGLGALGDAGIGWEGGYKMIRGYVAPPTPGTETANIIATSNMFVLEIVLMIILFGAALILLAGVTFMLYARLYVIWLLVIVSPLAFFSAFFTPLQGVWKSWWGWFLKWLMIGPAIFFLLRIMVIVGATVDTTAGGDQTLSLWGKWIFGLAILVVALKVVPGLMGGAVMGAWGAAGNFARGKGEFWDRGMGAPFKKGFKDFAKEKGYSVPGVGFAMRKYRDFQGAALARSEMLEGETKEAAKTKEAEMHMKNIDSPDEVRRNMARDYVNKYAEIFAQSMSADDIESTFLQGKALKDGRVLKFEKDASHPDGGKWVQGSNEETRHFLAANGALKKKTLNALAPDQAEAKAALERTAQERSDDFTAHDAYSYTGKYKNGAATAHKPGSVYEWKGGAKEQAIKDRLMGAVIQPKIKPKISRTELDSFREALMDPAFDPKMHPRFEAMRNNAHELVEDFHAKLAVETDPAQIARLRPGLDRARGIHAGQAYQDKHAVNVAGLHAFATDRGQRVDFVARRINKNISNHVAAGNWDAARAEARKINPQISLQADVNNAHVQQQIRAAGRSAQVVRSLGAAARGIPAGQLQINARNRYITDRKADMNNAEKLFSAAQKMENDARISPANRKRLQDVRANIEAGPQAYAAAFREAKKDMR